MIIIRMIFTSHVFEMVRAIILLIVWLFLLWFSADKLVNSSVRIAKYFKLSPLFIGLTILAIWTSAPELFLSAMAAINHSWSLSIWNIIWSNIFNLWIILWISALAVPVLIPKKLVLRDWVFLLIITALIFWMLRDGQVYRRNGILLLWLLIAYNWYLWIKKETPTEEDTQEPAPKLKNFVYLLACIIILSVLNITIWSDPVSFDISFGISTFNWIFCGILIILFILSLFIWKKKWSKWMLLNISKLVASLWLLVLSSDVVVDSAVYIAEIFWMSQRAIWATIIAAWTSLPELATTITAILKKKYDMWVWNLVWSNIFNTLGIIWISATITPITLTPVCLLSSGNCTWRAHLMQDTSFSFMLLFFTMLLIVLLMRRGRKLTRIEWCILLVISILVLAFQAKPSFFMGLMGI